MTISRSERTVLLPLVLFACVCSFLALLITAGRPAIAAAERWLDKVGPTEGVILSGGAGADEGDAPIEIRNVENRLAWSDSAHDRAYSVGLLNLNDVLPKMMNSERYVQQRDDLRAELQARDQEYQERNRELQEKYEGITRESPEFGEAMQAMEELNQEYQLFQRDAVQRINVLQGEQLERAYADIVSAVDVVCDERKIDLVFRYIPVDDEFTGETSADAMNEIRMRSVLRYPEGIDITDAILDEMALPLD